MRGALLLRPREYKMRRARFQTKNEQAPSKLVGRPSVWHVTWLTRTLAILVLCQLRFSARAEPLTWMPGLSQHTNHASLDLELSLRARKALLQDEVLAGQRLGISVRNRIATLWGSASSPS